jgi:hypothetical protein
MTTPYTDLMLDIETMGTTPDAPILSLGAVLFNSQHGMTGDEPKFHVGINLDDQLKRGAAPDASTMLWWLDQSAEARAELLRMQRTARHFAEAVGALNRFVREIHNTAPDAKIWGLPAAFDLTILRRAGHRHGSVLPWDHWNERCLRTIGGEFPKNLRPKPELAHDALADAMAQAHWLCNIRQAQRFLRGEA